MDFFFAFPTITVVGILAFSLFLCCLLFISRRISSCKKRVPPEAGGAWPLIGHLPLLGGKQPPQVTLGNLADKYGPIFTIHLGVHRTLIVSSWELAKECLTTNDKVFATRQKFLAAEIMGYNYAMFGFSPYGPYWRHMRKIATVELLSNYRLQKLKHVRESEVKAALKDAYEVWEKNKTSSDKVFIKMNQWLGDTTLNVIYRIIFGKRYTGYYARSLYDDEGNDQWLETIKNFFDLTGKFVVSDAVPFLRWLDLGGYEKAMKKTAKEFDHVVEGWLKEHKQRRVSGEVTGDEDFMDVMLSILDDADERPNHYDADTINKATCLVMILAASDTTKVTLIWTLCLLLNNREVLEKAQQELEAHVGRERNVNESDLNNLVYLRAIIKETLRLHPAAPTSVPHESMEDCTVGGYHIPAGTRLLVNLWKIHRDPRVWLDPCEFKPERFLTTHKDFDVRGNNFELIPFGSGRRMCPGVSFALQVMQLTMATLLHGFDISRPSEEPIEFSEGLGMPKLKDASLEVLLSPRLPAHLY